MKPKQIETLESYFKTDNEHWNDFSFKLLCVVLHQGNFENPVLPMQLFSDATDIFVNLHDSPLKAVEKFAEELEKNKLSSIQKLFLYEWICKYLNETEYKDLDLTPIKELLVSQNNKLKVENQPVKLLTTNMRDCLKTMMQKELEALPETLSKLEPDKRLNTLIKLMPFVFPKVESVHHEVGEPDDYKIKSWL